MAFLLAAAVGVGFAGGRWIRARGGTTTSLGERTERTDGPATMAGANSSDPVSPLRFGDQPGLLATEDAANPPFERLSTNDRFANEINE
ncbi:hypothetical protein FAGKG844_180096 [Frankia sp. AgKG'84/4]